jgi:hypothetical protein
MKIDLGKKQNSRYFAPKKSKEIHEKFLKYRNAELLANDINFNENNRYFVIIDGSFFFGDFIEAFIVKHNIHVKKMTISTLSMNKNNVDSLANLINGNYIDELNLLLSDYFYGHEKHDLIPYIYETLDIDNKFQLSFAGTHCKICIFETVNGRKFVFHGSANLRSSSNIEQIMLEESEGLYDFMDEIQNNILQEYKTINKSLRGNKLWQKVQNQEKEEEKAEEKEIQELVIGNRLEQQVNKQWVHRSNKIKF